MAIAQRRLPWRLPTKWAWAMEKAGPSRKEVAELGRVVAPLVVLWGWALRLVVPRSVVLRDRWWWSAMSMAALSLVLRLALWRDPARFPMALSLVLRLALWRDPARFLMALSLVLRLPLERQVPRSPAPTRLSRRAVPGRHLRPCRRLTLLAPPPGPRERRAQGPGH